MRSVNTVIEAYRQPWNGARTAAAGNNGAFRVPFRRVVLSVIASDGGGWDHVSVSLPDRCPTWEEMCYVRELFFAGDEWVIQYHPPRAHNINNHPFALHLWRPQGVVIPTPPPEFVGIPGIDAEQFARLTPQERARLVEKITPRSLNGRPEQP